MSETNEQKPMIGVIKNYHGSGEHNANYDHYNNDTDVWTRFTLNEAGSAVPLASGRFPDMVAYLRVNDRPLAQFAIHISDPF